MTDRTDAVHELTFTPDGNGGINECSRCGFRGRQTPPLPCEPPAGERAPDSRTAVSPVGSEREAATASPAGATLDRA